MSENTEAPPKKKLSLSRPGKLELKKTVEGGQVRQSFSHGRSKVVAVEVRKKRTFAPGSSGAMTEVKEAEELPEEIAEDTADEAIETILEDERSAAVGPTLTDQERAARVRALQDAQRIEESRKHEIPPPAAAPETEPADEAAAPESAPEAEESEQNLAEVQARLGVSDDVLRRRDRPQPSQPAAKTEPGKRDAPAEEEEDEESRRNRRGRVQPKRPAPVRRGEPRRRSGKLTITEALDENERVRSLASVKRAREKQKKKEGPIEHVKIVREVTVPETITVQELANRMAERGVDVVKALMKLGVMANVNQVIDADTAELVTAEFGHNVKRVSAADVEIGLEGVDDTEGDLQPRPPVVTVMGHVDHGKTSLLDALRKSNVVSGEAGGITQHIGAYQVATPQGVITFVDTPGHAAFTEMRQRGAVLTDIVVLVVAADDGIMPQTVEAISHAKAAGVPIVVAINKIDRPDADPNRARTQLLEHDLVPEAMGGDILDVEVSATEGTNLDKLLETVLLQAELLDLRANPERPADGTVVEARMEQGRGAVATILVQRGTLRVGDIMVAGAEWGRVRAMTDDLGETVEAALPSQPVEVVGLNAAPAAGDKMVVVESESRAREVTAFRQEQDRAARHAIHQRGTLEEMFTAIQSGESKDLPLVIKGDVQGSVEAIVGMLENLPQNEVRIQVIHRGVGAISESDVSLAATSGALVVGFNVRANKQARDTAAAEKVDIRYYSVIYELAEDVKGVLVGMMAPEIRESFLGNAEIREVFNVSKVGRVAGCHISEGMVRRGAKVRLLRDNVVIHEGSLSTLKRFKDDVREVKEGYECGMSFESYNDIKVGDVIECFEVQEIAPEI